MYQSGALRAFAEAAGGRLQHVKPHGAFYTMSAADEARPPRWYARSGCSAMASFSTEWARSSRRYQKRWASGTSGKATSTSTTTTVAASLSSATRAPGIRKRLRGERCGWRPGTRSGTVAGNTLPLAVQSICIHGDAPNSGDVARAGTTTSGRGRHRNRSGPSAVGRLNRIRAYGMMGGIRTMSAEVLSPLPGLVATVHVKTGDAVASGIRW